METIAVNLRMLANRVSTGAIRDGRQSSGVARFPIWVCGCVLFLLCGCMDLGSVKDYAGLSKQSSAGYAEIVEDMYQSCLRAAEFDPPTGGETPETHCADWKQVGPGLLRAESTLQDYLVALGKLAGNETVSYDKDMDSLKKNVEGIKISGKAAFDSKQVDSVTGLAALLLKAATDGYHRRELERTISAQNDNVETLTGALKAIVGHDYKTELENEQTSVQAFEVRVNRAPDQALAGEIGKREVHDHLRDIERKKAAADACVKILDLIAKGHQQLFEHKKDLGSKALAKLLLDDAAEMAPLLESIQKAF